MPSSDVYILLVDDYPAMRGVLRNLLIQAGYDNVEEAEDGADALVRMRERGFDLVISDWNMAPVSGIELLRAIRADDDLKTVPFIMVTAESASDSVAAARDAGVTGYIVKPFNAATLHRRIDLALGAR